jgi:hypothetical protein
MSTIPFSYYLYHKPTKQHYYGIKFSKGCHPDMLWTTYFSSSSIVKQLIIEYGVSSFEYQIRKTFDSGKSALLWEHKVLRRLKAAERKDWINRHNGGSKFRGPEHHSPQTIEKFRKKLIGQKRSEESKERYRISAKKREEKRRSVGWKMPSEAIDRAVKTRQEKIKSGIINPYSKERNKKMSESKKGTKRHYLPDGSFIMIKPQDDQ